MQELLAPLQAMWEAAAAECEGLEVETVSKHQELDSHERQMVEASRVFEAEKSTLEARAGELAQSKAAIVLR